MELTDNDTYDKDQNKLDNEKIDEAANHTAC